MEKNTEILKRNLEKQIERMKQERTDREYVYAIQQVMKDKLNEPKKPLTFISGSNTIYNIDNVDCIVNKYTPYLAD
jgi:hypothetical protein